MPARPEIGTALHTDSTVYSLQTVRPRRYSENLNVSVLCPLPPTFGLLTLLACYYAYGQNS